MALFALTFLVLAPPYVVYLRHTTGRLLVSGKAGITTTLGAAITDLGSALGEDAGSVLDSTGQEIFWLSPEQFDAGRLDEARADPELAARQLARNLLLVPDVVLGELAESAAAGAGGAGSVRQTVESAQPRCARASGWPACYRWLSCRSSMSSRGC